MSSPDLAAVLLAEGRHRVGPLVENYLAGLTTTDPGDWDSDGGGAPDGAEDRDRDGAVRLEHWARNFLAAVDEEGATHVMVFDSHSR